jgi:hypothetical protein
MMLSTITLRAMTLSKMISIIMTLSITIFSNMTLGIMALIILIQTKVRLGAVILRKNDA